jgi:hypothetical protein
MNEYTGKTIRTIVCTLIAMMWCTVSIAQTKQTSAHHFTGNAKIDLLSRECSTPFSQQFSSDVQASVSQKKSVLIASALSFLLPGAGEYYGESYWKSGIFLGLEVAGITTALIYNSKGNTQTDFFQNYADDHYSVIKYFLWIKENHAGWNVRERDEVNRLVSLITINANTNLPPWQRIDWNLLNDLESAIGNSFSHTMPQRPQQQYYELIGKYKQFRAGWDDFDSTFAGYASMETHNYPVSPRFSFYSVERGKANDFYDVAKFAVNMVILNHLLSAIDAAFTVGSYNAQFSSQLRFEKEETFYGMNLVPQLTMQVRF